MPGCDRLFKDVALSYGSVLYLWPSDIVDATMHTELLSASDLTIGYGQHRVAEGLSLSMNTGQLICLLGPNGAGKSTLLRTLGGLMNPLSGTIRIAETLSPFSASFLARRLAVVLSEFEGIGGIRARELVELGRAPYLGWYGKAGAEDQDIIQESLRETATIHLADRQVATLSDGEKQRVMIARALAQKTDLILLDEPTSHLDLEHRIGVMRLLHRLSRQQQKSILLSTHDLDLAIQGADYLWIMTAAGELVQGYPEDLLFSGQIAEVYGGKDQFDWMNGGLKLLEKGDLPLYLNLTPEEKIWVRRALARHGVTETEDQNGAASLSRQAGQWTFSHASHTVSSNSLGELLLSIALRLGNQGTEQGPEDGSGRSGDPRQV